MKNTFKKEDFPELTEYLVKNIHLFLDDFNFIKTLAENSLKMNGFNLKSKKVQTGLDELLTYIKN